MLLSARQLMMALCDRIFIFGELRSLASTFSIQGAIVNILTN
ncbi:hypothetical protein [Brunnivagina elsteri]|nr:hypothetical protein [Calothrix elsteri]